MRKSKIIDYLDNKREQVIKPLRKKLQQMKDDECINAIESKYPDFIPVIEKYIESKNAVCDILDQMNADDFHLRFIGLAYRENRNASECALSNMYFYDDWRYSKDVEDLDKEIYSIRSEYQSLKGNIKGMTAKKAIAYLKSLGFDIQPDEPRCLPIAPVDTQLLLRGLQDE